MVKVKRLYNDECDEDAVDTIEDVTLDSKGVYSSLMGTLLIVMPEHKAELQLISQGHIRVCSYSNLSILISCSLYQELKNEEDFASVAICTPAVEAIENNESWSPFPT